MSKARAENRELPKRFYNHVDIQKSGSSWAIKLDGRVVKTPAKQALEIPIEALADAIAREWDAQKDHIDPFTMPLTRICNVALDRMADVRHEAVEEIARFARTDLLSHRSDHPELAERQAQLWDPYLDWSAQALDAPLKAKASLLALEQAESSIDALKRRALALDDFRLTGLVSAVPLLTSAVLGFALLEAESDGETLWSVAQLEIEFQVEKWGHDREASQQAQRRKSDLLACETLFRTLDADEA